MFHFASVLLAGESENIERNKDRINQSHMIAGAIRMSWRSTLSFPFFFFPIRHKKQNSFLKNKAVAAMFSFEDNNREHKLSQNAGKKKSNEDSDKCTKL